tara:strand:- start:289 stop:438 length:150 start_codon:yes stop_codon:yes gene_type:complete
MKITEKEFAELKDSLVFKDDHTSHELIVALSEVTYMHSRKTHKMEEKNG